MTHEVSLALVGNPNCGKTSLFNELTGSNHSVGNWPGVTVERKTGIIKGTDNIVLQDLPGIYSMSPYSPEEVVARDYLIQDIPDAVLNIVDASNLERNLYLTLQLLETGHPVIVVLNMMDVVKKQGTLLNDNQLGYLLGVQTIPISVTKNQGLQELTHIISKRRSGFSPIVNYPTYDDRLEVALDEISQLIEPYVSAYQLRWYSIKLFEKDTQVMEVLELPPDIQQEIAEIITISEKVFDDDSESIIVNARYEFIDDVTAMCLQHSPTATQTMSDKIDRVVTNKWLALPIFAIVMWFVYYLAIQTVGALGTDWVNERLFGEYIPHITSYWLATWQVAPWLQSLILDGILAGVGAVLGFVPQLMVLFLCLSFLEDCGYMSRIAFVMDRLFRRFGLSGKSFIPMLVATGCGVPGIMASRTIENEKDRRMTIMTTTFMPCSAKLPIIGLISGAFFPRSSWVAPSAYFFGIGAIVLSGILLKKTALFSGEPAPFIMELPNYHWPRLKNSFRQTIERSKSFVKKAGTIIFACSVFIWFLSSFNWQFKMVTTDQSLLALLGKGLAPLFVPLGWGNWQATVATLTGLIAKENVVGTFGILYAHLPEISETGKEFWPLFSTSLTPVAGYSFLLFNLLCAPCFAAVGAIRREMSDWRWTTLAISYQCGLAYLVSFLVYQLASVLLGYHSFSLGTGIAITLLIGLIGWLILPQKKAIKDLPGIKLY